MAGATLQYDFAVVGAKNVERAFTSIEQKAVRHNMRMSRAFGGTGASSRRAPNINAAARAAERIQKKQTLEAVRAERTIQREQARTARHRERALKKQSQLELAAFKRSRAEEERGFKQAVRLQQRARRVNERAMATAVREKRRASQAIFGRVGNSAFGATRAVGAVALGGLALGGGVAVGSALAQQSRETAMASQLANQAGTPKLKGTLLRESQNVRGFTGEESLAALSGFVDLTGDLDTARMLLKDLGRVSLATGTEFADMSTLAGNLANNLQGIEDPAERAKAIMTGIKGLAFQGGAGAVEVKNLASQGGSLAAIAGGIGGDQTQALLTAGVLTQVAKTKSSSPEEALTAAQNFIDMLGAHADKIEGTGKGKLGIKGAFVKGEGDSNIAIADPKQLIKDVFEKTGGDIGTITKIFGQRGQRVFKGFSDAYQRNGASGIDEVFDKFNGTLSDSDINERASSRLQDTDLQFKEAMRDFNAQVGSQLLPVVTKLIPEFAALLPHVRTAARIFGKLVESIAESPIATIGQIVAAKVVADLAAAHIGDAVKGALTSSVTRGGKGLDISGAIGSGLTLGAGTALSIYAYGVTSFEQSETRLERGGEIQTRLRELNSPEDLPEAKSLLAEQEKLTAQASKASWLETLLGESTRALPAWLGGDTPAGKTTDERINFGKQTATDLGFRNIADETTQRKNEEAARQKVLELQSKAIDKQAASIDKFAIAVDKMPVGGGGSTPPARRPQQGT